MRATRQQTHLNKCIAYINKSFNLFSSSVQTKLSSQIWSLSSSIIKTLNRTTAMTVYMSNLSFNHYENSYIWAHEHIFYTQYISSLHLIMTEVLLNEIYQMMKTKINSMLISHYLNFFSNESTNIQKKKVINLCMHILKTATSNEEEFHLRIEVNVTEIMNAKTQAHWLLNHIDETLQNQFWRMNTFVIDTCFTMRALWSELEAFDELKHVFFILCDSHDLQLLLDDIMNLSWFTKILERAQWMIKFFLAALKKLTILWKFQMMISTILCFHWRCLIFLSSMLVIFLFQLVFYLSRIKKLNITRQNCSSLSLLKNLSQFYWLIHILIIFFL